jgi:hypothetical protein
MDQPAKGTILALFSTWKSYRGVRWYSALVRKVVDKARAPNSLGTDLAVDGADTRAERRVAESLILERNVRY